MVQYKLETKSLRKPPPPTRDNDDANVIPIYDQKFFQFLRSYNCLFIVRWQFYFTFFHADTPPFLRPSIIYKHFLKVGLNSDHWFEKDLKLPKGTQKLKVKKRTTSCSKENIREQTNSTPPNAIQSCTNPT